VLPNSSIRGSGTIIIIIIKHKCIRVYFLLVTNISLICLIIDFYFPLSASLSRDSNYAAFEDWCKHRGTTFSSEEDKHCMFELVYRYIYIYNGRQYPFGGYSSGKSRAPKFGRHGDPEVMYKKPRCTTFSLLFNVEDALKNLHNVEVCFPNFL
jgi:hypothetical protein